MSLVVTADTAVAAAVITPVVFEIAANFMLGWFHTSSLGLKLLASLGFGVATTFGFQIISAYEGTGMMREVIVQSNISKAVLSSVKHKLAFVYSSV